MAYVKPGVTVKQVQKTVSPNLAPPSLNACIIGVPYYVVETTDDIDVYDSSAFSSVEKYDNSSGSVAYLSLPSGATLDGNSVYVDILSTTGSWYHVDSSKYSANSQNATVSISGNLGSTLDNGTIRVGYRAVLSGLNDFFTVASLQDIEDRIGKPTTYNPLAFGLSQALMNAGTTVSAYGCLEDTTTEHSNARDTLSLHEVYALAPMTHQNVHSAYASHVETLSSETNKKERIVFLNPKWSWYQSDGTTITTGPLDSNTDKNGTVTGMAAVAFAVGKKRVFYINPDTVYVEETRPLATVKQSYLADSNSLVSTYGLYAQFTESWTYRPGTPSEKKYFAGDDITDAAWSQLMDNTYGYPDQEITVMVPVPGYYLAAGIAGQVSGQRPEQGFTNLALAGDYSKLKYSGDYFTEAQLDTLAGGGNWIMWQANSAAPIVTRHQLSTDRSSVEKQELSITKSLDFVAKFIRDGVSPYIGKYNVTSAFLTLIKQLIVGQGIYLRREGYINDLKVDKVEQDSVSKDTILVTISVSVQYPVNYIKITLQF
jgi:hypothetical protein